MTGALSLAVGVPAAVAAAPQVTAAALGVTATIPVGSRPSAVATNPLTNTIYLADQGDNTVSVISGRTDTLVATVPVRSFPAAVATNPLTNTI